MINRWTILFVLFFARTTMAFQFQSIAALSPLMQEAYGLSLVDIGLLIGLYLAPGVVVAIPGGTFAARFGDKRIVAASLLTMALGGILLAWGPGDWSLTAGRVLAGIGGVVTNVVMTKLVVDWFAGREISTAMAIFINSWPVGIALALLILPGLAAIGGLGMAWAVVVGTILVGFVLFVLVYRVPEGAAQGATDVRVARFPIAALFLAGMIWALYNSALAIVFSFGPALLTERGMDLVEAGSVVSLFMIVFSIAVPLGGFVADRSGRRDSVILVSLAGFALVMPLALFSGTAALPILFAVAGALFGLSAGPIVGLPSGVLSAQARAFAMGCYFTVYYAWMMAVPALAGGLADWSGTVDATIWVGTGMSIAAMICLLMFRRIARTLPASVSP